MREIFILIHELNHSGVAVAATTLANIMHNKNMPYRLVVIGEKQGQAHNNLKIDFLGIKRGRGVFGKIKYFLQCFFKLPVFLAKNKCKNLFVWGKEFTVMAVFFRILFPLPFKLIGVNVVGISSHIKNKKSPLVRYVLNYLYTNFLNRADHIITQSHGMYKELVDIYNIPENKISITYPLINSKFFNERKASKKQNNILFIGRLVEEKNPCAALEIFSKLSNKQCLLEIIGDGNLLEKLQEKANKLSITERVNFVGKQDDILPFIQKADALILTSKYEGFGMVLVEAIAVGVPVISFNCPVGPAEIIIDGVNGYLIPEGNTELFVKKIEETLVKKWNYNRIRETAQKFHPDNVVKIYLEAIKHNCI